MYRFGFQRVEVRDASRSSGSLIEYLSARTAGIENAMRMCTVAIVIRAAIKVDVLTFNSLLLLLLLLLLFLIRRRRSNASDE